MMPEVPPERMLDLFTRIDDLLVLNLEATRGLTVAIDKLSAALAVAPPVAPPVPPLAVPPPRIVVAPAPAELVPLTTRLDSIDANLKNSGTKLDRLIELSEPERKGKPVSLTNKYEGTDTDWQKVSEWRVGDIWGYDRGRLDEVSMSADPYLNARFRFTAAGKVMFKNLELIGALTHSFRVPNEFKRGDKITLECRSSDGTNINVNMSITGRAY